MATPPDAEAQDPPRARRRVPAKVWMPVGLAVVLVAGLLAWALARPQSHPSGLAGSRAPGFALARLGGGAEVRLPSGRPVVVNFFASWCPDCRRELAAFAGAARRGAGRVDFVGIDTSETSTSAARSLLAQAGVRYPVGVDPAGTTAAAYEVALLPITVFVYRSGQVAGEGGIQTPASLRSWVSRLEG